MEVHLNPDVEKRLNDLAAQSGRAPDELLQDALAGYLGEVAQTRETLDRRYDELKNGQVRPVLADEVEAIFATRALRLDGRGSPTHAGVRLSPRSVSGSRRNLAIRQR